MKAIEAMGKILPVCEHCGKSFVKSSDLRSHIDSVHLNIKKEFKCHVCEAIHYSRTGWSNHMKQYHNQEEALQCKICKKYFGKLHSLKVHEASHEPPKFRCDYCGKMLKSAETLKFHLRSHFNENPVKCKYCDYACKAGSVLRKHVLARHANMLDENNREIVPK